MVAVSLGLVAILWDGAVGRLAGAALFGGLIVYIAGNIWLARRMATKEVENEYAEGVPARSGSLLLDGLFLNTRKGFTPAPGILTVEEF